MIGYQLYLPPVNNTFNDLNEYVDLYILNHFCIIRYYSIQAISRSLQTMSEVWTPPEGTKYEWFVCDTPPCVLPGMGWHLSLETYSDEACSQLPPVPLFFSISASREKGFTGTRKLRIRSPSVSNPTCISGVASPAI